MEIEKDNSTRTAFFLNLSFTVPEVIGGIISGSIAILADSLHRYFNIGILLNGISVWKLKSGKSMNKQVMTIHLLEDHVTIDMKYS